jgi:hypothetical protein
MKYILTESQYNLLLEQTSGLDEFLVKVKETYNIDDEFINKIKEFVVNSDCKRIIVQNIRMGEALALSDRLVMSPRVFTKPLAMFLFILFHEVAHQYQYKKYGEEKMYSVYVGDTSLEDASEFMKNTEIVADEFAARKVREFVKSGFIPEKDATFNGMYKNIPIQAIMGMIQQFRSVIKQGNITKPSDVSEFFYNMVKSDL